MSYDGILAGGNLAHDVVRVLLGSVPSPDSRLTGDLGCLQCKYGKDKKTVTQIGTPYNSTMYYVVLRVARRAVQVVSVL